MVDARLSSTFKLLTCFNLQCEFFFFLFSHYYMIFCFSNYKNYSLVLFYFNVMFKLNELFLSINVILALHGGCVSSSWPTHIQCWSLGFLLLFGSHLLPKFPQLKRECVWLKLAVTERSRWLTERAFVDEPKIENSRDLGDWKTRLSLLLVGLERVVIWWDQLY